MMAEAGQSGMAAADLVQAQASLITDDSGTGEDGNVLEVAGLALTEARGLDGDDLMTQKFSLDGSV